MDGLHKADHQFLHALQREALLLAQAEAEESLQVLAPKGGRCMTRAGWGRALVMRGTPGVSF